MHVTVIRHRDSPFAVEKPMDFEDRDCGWDSRFLASLGMTNFILGCEVRS